MLLTKKLKSKEVYYNINQMQSLTKEFKKYIAQASNFEPFQLEINKAEGIYVEDIYGKNYFDLMSGISVSNIGHRHPKVLEAIKQQLEAYMHVMVYGEFIESPQIKLAEKLCSLLPENLNSIFYVNSGSEAIEGAIKLAKKFTRRTEIIAFKNSYHGSTTGAISLLSRQEYKQPLPDIKILEFNKIEDIKHISEKTACVVTEVIQAGAGIIPAHEHFITALNKKCKDVGALLVLDEIQTCYGRTGKLFAFEHYNITPDILCIGKSFGGEMPLGAFISSNQIMDIFNEGHPLYGHATTFGGHPVCCASSLATLNVLLNDKIIQSVNEKSELFIKNLDNHPAIKEIRGIGLFLAIELVNNNIIEKVVEEFINNGIITFWFLFNHNSFSITPPLTISNYEIKTVCEKIIKVLNKFI